MAGQFTAGIQHLGIPTNDMKATIDFYTSLGFKNAHETILKDDNCRVVFLKLDNLVVESYEDHKAVLKAGAIDHIAIDTTDINAAWEFAKKGSYKILNDSIQSLPFWANGVKFFKIEGPNKEIIEFCQIL